VPQRRFRHPVVLAPDVPGRWSAIVDPEFCADSKSVSKLVDLDHFVLYDYAGLRNCHLDCALEIHEPVHSVSSFAVPVIPAMDG
jgi:hypothetical protein